LSLLAHSGHHCHHHYY
jgi:hypothetical protein